MNNLVSQNKSLLITRNYVRKADPDADYWVDFSNGKLQQYIAQFEEDFNLIIWGDESTEGDFYVVPFSAVKHIFVEQYYSADKRQRWIGRIKYHQLRINNYPYPFDLVDSYGEPELLNLPTIGNNVKEKSGSYQVDPKRLKYHEAKQNDFAIENRKIEIKARQKQSRFRKDVLNNFQRQCCVSGITEEDLLVASHIIPWAKKIETRLDPSNGLCLSILYDKLFDKGYISFDENYEVIITNQFHVVSNDLRRILHEIAGTKMRQPIKNPIKQEYLEFHRSEVFEKT